MKPKKSEGHTFMKSMNDRRRKHNPHRGQVIEMPRKITCTLLEETELKIYGAWTRGVTERELARQYRVGREEIEDICRERARGGKAAA